MPYVLIVIIMTGHGHLLGGTNNSLANRTYGQTVSMEQFSSKENCERAAGLLRQEYSVQKVYCVPK